MLEKASKYTLKKTYSTTELKHEVCAIKGAASVQETLVFGDLPEKTKQVPTLERLATELRNAVF